MDKMKALKKLKRIRRTAIDDSYSEDSLGKINHAIRKLKRAIRKEK